MSSQHALCEEDRKYGENRKSRKIQAGWALGKSVRKTYISYQGLLSAPAFC